MDHFIIKGAVWTKHQSLLESYLHFQVSFLYLHDYFPVWFPVFVNSYYRKTRQMFDILQLTIIVQFWSMVYISLNAFQRSYSAYSRNSRLSPFLAFWKIGTSREKHTRFLFLYELTPGHHSAVYFLSRHIMFFVYLLWYTIYINH